MYNMPRGYHPYYHSNKPPTPEKIKTEEKHEDYKMKLEGKGTVTVKPDIATVTIGVVTEDEDLEEAKRENAEKAQSLLEVLKDMGIEEDDIQTETYSIDQEYDYVEGKKEFRGYKVTNTLTITIRDLDAMGEIIDEAVSSGANTVDNIKFSISNPDDYYNEALNIAIRNAIKKAESIERNIPIRVNKVPVSITEQNYGSTYPVERTYMKAMDTTTIIESGQLEINARVITEFNYIRV